MISRPARAAPTQTMPPGPSVSFDVLTMSSPDVESPGALGDADAEADALALAFFSAACFSAAFAEALADALGLADTDALGLAFGFGLGAGAGGAVYGVTLGLWRELEVWNLKATQPPVGTLNDEAPELAYVHPPPLPLDQNSAQYLLPGEALTQGSAGS